MSFDKFLTREFLIKQYIDNKLSTIKIAKLINCSASCIILYLKKYNIERHTLKDARINYKHSEITKNKIKVSNIKTKSKQRHLYIGKNNPFYGKKHTKEIIIKLRKISINRNLTGKNNPNWQGGGSNESYPWYFNKKLRNKIRKRDNYTCQRCEILEKEYFSKRNKSLDVHHIDYNKQNCDESNLLTLCGICNSKANANRDYWFAYYTYIMENKQ